MTTRDDEKEQPTSEATTSEATSPQPPKIAPISSEIGGPLDPSVDILEYAEAQQARWKIRDDLERKRLQEEKREPFKSRTISGNKRTDF